MRKITYRMWDILYPVFIYYLISSIVFFALGMILGSKQELYMVKQLISSGATIPFLVVSWKQDNEMERIVYGQRDSTSKRRNLERYVVQAILAGIAVGCLGMACNNFIAMTPLMQVSDGFSTANENFFAGTMPIEILASCVVVPVAEELLFRGIVQKRCARLAGEHVGLLFSALLFGIIHVNLVQFLYAAVLGLVLGVIVQKTKKVSLAVVGHAMANLIAILRAETGIFEFSYYADWKGVSFSLILLCVGLAAGYYLTYYLTKERR